MALTAPNEDRRGLKELLNDESGSATVEFLVLLPVYLVFIIGVFQLTWLVMAHQACQQAARVDGWIDGKNSATLFVGYMGDYDPGNLRESSPTFSNDDFTTGSGAARRDLLRSLLRNDFGQGGHPIIHRQRTVTFTYRGVILGNQTVDLHGASSVYVFNPNFVYPAHQRGQRNHFFAENAVLRPPFDPAEDPNNIFLHRQVNRHFTAGEGIWERSAQSGRIDGSVQSEHTFYRSRRP